MLIKIFHINTITKINGFALSAHHIGSVDSLNNQTLVLTVIENFWNYYYDTVSIYVNYITRFKIYNCVIRCDNFSNYYIAI